MNVDTVRPGGQFRVHLVQPLMLDGTQLAPAGTLAHLIVSDKKKRADGAIALDVWLTDFRLKLGELPLVPVTATLSAITSGMAVPALTQGIIAHEGERFVIRVPVPMLLSSAAPNAPYTPIPAATPAPVRPGPRRGATPTPLPTTFNPPDVSPPPAPEPATT